MGIRQVASKIAFRLGVKRNFWVRRRSYSKLRFRLRATRYAIGSERSQTIAVLRFSLATVASQTVYALGLVALALAIDWVLPLLNFTWGVPLRQIDGASYVTTAAAVLQTMGVFLGLLFTAVGVVIGSGYGRVATDIRELVIGDKLSDRYLKIVALTGIYALFLCGLNVSRLAAPRAGILFLFALTTFGVFSFIAFGFRVYRLLHPESVARLLNAQVAESMHQLHGSHPYARDISFQTHHRKIIERAVATYEQLLGFVNTDPPNLASSKDVVLGQTLLLGIYTDLKSRIPVGSAWYPERAVYGSILASDDSSLVTVHIPTATMPLPGRRRDYLWFEKKIAEVVSATVAFHLERGDLRRAIDILSALQLRIHGAAKALAVDEALLVERIVSGGVLNAVEKLTKLQVSSSRPDPERAGSLIELADFIVFTPMQILLGFAGRVAGTLPASLIETEDWPRWYLKREFYGASLPRPVLEELEETATRLEFERDVEGRIVSADWYLREKYASTLIGHVISAMEPIFQRIEQACVPVVERLIVVELNVPAMHVALRGAEICHKFGYHLLAIENWCTKMRNLHVRTEAAAVPVDVEAMLKQLERVESALYETIAKLSFSMYESGASSRERDLPDYFGRVYMMLAARTFERMRDGKEDAPGLFRVVFGLSILAIQRLIDETADVEPVARVTYLSEPYLHVLELSGYAFLYSQVHGLGELWRVVRKTWEGAFGRQLTTEAVRAIYKEHSVFMRPWQTMRFNWQRTFRDNLEDAAASRPLSPILNVVSRYIESRHGMDRLDARDVFFFVFLRFQVGFEDAELPDAAESLQKIADRGPDDTPRHRT
jgi:hypothetical protein